MEKAHRRRGGSQGVFAESMESLERAHEVGQDELFRTVDRTIHVGFRRQMHHVVDLMLGERLPEGRSIANVRLDEDVAGISIHSAEILRIARVGQFVVIDDLRHLDAEFRLRPGRQVVDEIWSR